MGDPSMIRMHICRRSKAAVWRGTPHLGIQRRGLNAICTDARQQPLDVIEWNGRQLLKIIISIS